jgi:hypothetical protein
MYGGPAGVAGVAAPSGGRCFGTRHVSGWNTTSPFQFDQVAPAVSVPKYLSPARHAMTGLPS